MKNQRSHDDDKEQIDVGISRSICHAVAERLRRDLQPEPSPVSSRLEGLMDELRRRDDRGHTRSSKI